MIERNLGFEEAFDRYCVRAARLESEQRAADKIKEGKRVYGGRFSPSFISTNKCDRALHFHYRGDKPEGDTDARLHRIFANGSTMHERIQHMCSDMGILAEEDVEVRIEPDSNQYKISGYVDGVVQRGEERIVLEIKSINQRGFDYAVQNGPKAEHAKQAQIYMWALELKRAILFYECKNTQRIAAWTVHYEPLKVKHLLDRLEKTIQDVELGKVPQMTYNPVIRECQWCNWQERCQGIGGNKRRLRFIAS